MKHALLLIRCAATLIVLTLIAGLAWLAFASLKPEVQIAFLSLLDHLWVSLVDLIKTAIESPGFWIAAGSFGAWLQSWLNGRKATKAVLAAEGAQIAAVQSREVLETKIDLNTQLTQTSALNVGHANLMIKGAERDNVQKGMEIERNRSSGFDQLKPGVDIHTDK